jgi:hypothetical protein
MIELPRFLTRSASPISPVVNARARRSIATERRLIASGRGYTMSGSLHAAPDARFGDHQTRSDTVRCIPTSRVLRLLAVTGKVAGVAR